jgi:hypothetical protein
MSKVNDRFVVTGREETEKRIVYAIDCLVEHVMALESIPSSPKFYNFTSFNMPLMDRVPNISPQFPQISA